jgi:nitrite reductase/ring-hydroxylating ferredoxin subunit
LKFYDFLMEGNTSDNTTTASVGATADFTEGTMKMATVGTRRIVVIRTASGLHALDNACPHQGYGMATGALDGELITCQWHNWKFDVRDGSCVRGEEAIPCHAVTIDGDDVLVSVTEPTNEQQREALWPSLRSGMERHYVGQVARDTARLLRADASPAEIMADALAIGAPKNEWGIGHEMATAADCLAWSEIRTGDEQALPLVQGLSGISEVSRDRPARPVPAPDATIDFGTAIESEDVEGAMASVVASIHDGAEPAHLRHEFIDAVSQHHLDYGHGIIYTQKAFEILDRIGWSHAPDLLPHLAASIGWGTREDVLPYMRKAMRSIESVDLGALAAAEDRTTTGWYDDDLVDRLLVADTAPIEIAAEAVLQGAGVEGLLDAVTIGASRRLLRHDLDVEFNEAEDFGWLDITHALTMSRAVRWAWQNDPGPHTARLAMFATWLLFDSGRAERRHGVPQAAVIDTPATDFGRAIRSKDVGASLGWVHAAERTEAVDALIDAALADQAGSFIVHAHVIKLTQAAAEEAETIDSVEPLLAAARFTAAPRLERFVGANVAASLDFVQTGSPPKR